MHRDACIVRSSWNVEKNQKVKGGRLVNRNPGELGRKGRMKKSSVKSKKVRIRRDC